ncbi:MAG: hypothetical protein M1827_006233 [Pycnora praestabilis]|nr:MAG: hypothetical protein M1827_006233 [Pycnora praestabilis]
MRFLCLHGMGTSAAIFKSQTTAFRSKLDSSTTFDFVDGPCPSNPAPGIDLFYDPPYYKFWEGPSLEAIRGSHKWLLDLIENDGPYDGVLLFSQGCSLIASFLLYHRAEKGHLPPPFKVAVFICGGLPLGVVEDIGVHVSPEARDWDDRSKKGLAQQASSAAILERGVQRWTNTNNIDPSAPIDPSNVFGLDLSHIPSKLLINIPTVHIYGSKDPRYPASIQLSLFCEPAKRKTFDHKGGHDIPRTTGVSDSIAELVEWSAFMASR